MSDPNQNTEKIQQNMTGNNTEVESVEVVDAVVDAAVADVSTDVTVEASVDETNTDVINETTNETDHPTFEVDEESEDESDEEEPDLSKYTVLDADNLDEDAPIPGQEFALFSFMSPEGIMNCNIRALKFRGAFPTQEKAEEYAEELKKNDKYFRILCAESGKWVEFDPPEEHVEKVVAGNKKQQKIIDAQRKARMDKMNELSGRHKQNIDKSDRGSKSRIEESKKAGAAEDYANKNGSKTQTKKAEKQQKMQQQAQRGNGRSARAETARDRLRKKLEAKRQKAQGDKAESANKNRLEKTGGDAEVREVSTEERYQSGQVNEEDLQRKTNVVNQASAELETKKSELERTNANIDKIRKMMQKK